MDTDNIGIAVFDATSIARSGGGGGGGSGGGSGGGLGSGSQIWHNLTGSGTRAFNTTYTNSNAYPIQVSIMAQLRGADATLVILVGGVVAGQNQGNPNYPQPSVSGIIVPAGATYRAQIETGTIGFWGEFY
jgi:hypothetical protein